MTDTNTNRLATFTMNEYLLQKFLDVLEKQTKNLDKTITLLGFLANEYGFLFSESGNNNFLFTTDFMPLINFYIDDDELIKYSILDGVLIIK